MQEKQEEKKNSGPKITEEERKARSERAKELVRQGKFGGAQRGQGRKRQQRASEQVAEEASKKASKIIAAIESALQSDSPSVRLKAAIEWLEIERKETERQDKREQQLFENATRPELLEIIAERLVLLREAGISIPGMDFDIDGQATEIIERPGIEEVSSESGRSSEAREE